MPRIQPHWHVSAIFYRFSYLRISHQVDDDLFAYLGRRIVNAVVADCGCGPGIVSEKLLQRGAAKVFAIDANASMLKQTRRRLAPYIERGQLETVQQKFGLELFGYLKEKGDCMDIVLFKRSLYGKPEETRKILQAASHILSPAGILVVIHPERSLRRYAFGPNMEIMPHTAYHLFNRTMSMLIDRLGLGQYTIYGRAELLEMICMALPHFRVNSVRASQDAYNIVAAHEIAKHNKESKKNESPTRVQNK